MRVVFMGTPSFAVPALDALARHHDVAAVYTRPDRESGRGKRVVASPVKERALEIGVPLEQPPTLRDACAAVRLATYAPDLVVVAAFGAILPAEFLAVPPMGCVNVHGSLLPRWRGAAPVQRAILAGDAETGVTIMRMEEGLDTGPTADRATTHVDDKTADELTTQLARAGAAALLQTLESIENGTVLWTPQPEEGATYASKVTAADVALAPSLLVEDALRRVRASTRSAPCRAVVGGRRVVVVSASRAATSPGAGVAVCAGGLALGLADGAISLDTLVPEGRKEMTGEAFARGARLDATCPWEAA